MERRSRSRNYSHGRLVEWIQRRCVRCQRFLGKKQLVHCSKCKYLTSQESQRKYYRGHREEKMRKTREYYRRNKLRRE